MGSQEQRESEMPLVGNLEMKTEEAMEKELMDSILAADQEDDSKIIDNKHKRPQNFSNVDEKDLHRARSPDSEIYPTSPFGRTDSSHLGGSSVLNHRVVHMSVESMPRVKKKGVKGFLIRNKTIIKISVLFIMIFASCATIMLFPEGEEESHMFVLKRNQSKFVDISPDLKCDYLNVRLRGNLIDKYPTQSAKEHISGAKGIEASLCSVPSNLSADAMVAECRASFPINVVFFTTHTEEEHHVKDLTYRFEILHEKVAKGKELHLRLQSAMDEDIAIDLSIMDIGKHGQVEVYVGFAILLFLYFMIVTDMVHRTVAAMTSAVFAIAALNFFKEGPTMEKMVDWIDWETLLLLFGMMLMVTIFAESGFFDYCAIICCRLAGGRKWLLIFMLCFASAFISAFLDNVTTVLLMTPVIIKICEAHNYDPINILIPIVLMSNVGGAGTGIGDPPNVLIVNNDYMKKIGIDFLEFTMHMSGAATFCFIVGCPVIYLLYHKVDFTHVESAECQKLRHKIAMWTKYANRIPTVTREETHIRKMISRHIFLLEELLEEKMKLQRSTQTNDWKAELKKIESSSGIKDYPLMIKSIVVLTGVVALFFVQSAPFVHADLGFIAFSGALTLVVLANEEEIETLIEKIEWTTLIFFASLFVLMEALTELHLLDFIGDRTVSLIGQVDPQFRFPFALIIVLWVSALSSSFVDNIPFTQAMIPIVIQLGESDENLPTHPLVWALALGACLGGNGTLIGASANLVCAAAAQQKGYKITFNRFFKTGFPFMLCTTTAASVYLIFFHVFPLQWNYLY